MNENLTVREDGRIVSDGMVIGRLEGRNLVFDAGWVREAGMGIRVKNDPEKDRHRSGYVLDRPA